MADPIYLVEMTGYTDAGTSTVYRYATRGYTTTGSDSPAHTHYEARVIDPGTISRSLFSGGSSAARANPRAQVGYGMARLANIDGALDSIFGGASGVSFRERQIRVLSVQEGAAYSTAMLLLRACVGQAQMSIGEVSASIKDRLYELDSDHQTTLYAGTNSLPNGLEGVDDLKGKPKPLLFGKVFSVEPPCVNTSRLIYQISNRAMQSVDGVYDGGVVIAAGATYADQAAMEATAPAAGQYRAWLAGGMIRLGSSPAIALTVDATGDTAGNSTAAQLLKTLALARGVDSGDISGSDVTALDAANSSVLGVWVNDTRSTLDVMDEIARSVGAAYWYDRTGVLRMQRFDAPSGAAIASLATWNVREVEQIPTGEDVPTTTVRLRYARYYRKHALTEVAGSVSEADRADLQQEWRVTTYATTPAPNPHKRLQTMERDTAFATKANADTEATRLHGIVGVPRRVHELRDVYLDDAALSTLDLNGVIGLRWSRYGFSSDTETLRRVVGMTSSLRDRRCTLLVWGA